MMQGCRSSCVADSPVAAAALRYVRGRFDAGEYAMYEEDGYRTLQFSAEYAICHAAGLPTAGDQPSRAHALYRCVPACARP